MNASSVPIMFLGNNASQWMNASSVPFYFQYQRSSALNAAEINVFKYKSPGLSQIKKLSVDNEIPTDKRELWDKHICLLPRIYSLLQREQWKRASEELSMYDTANVMNSYTPPTTDEGRFHLEFYVHPYYLYNMMLVQNLRGVSSIDRNPTVKQVNYFTIYKVNMTCSYGCVCKMFECFHYSGYYPLLYHNVVIFRLQTHIFESS